MAIKYSIQSSLLTPNGVSEPYGRFQVSYNETITELVLQTSIATLVEDLKDGRPIHLLDSNNVSIGQLLPTLKGGFLISEDPTPQDNQVNIGFRPSHQLLTQTRMDCTFERVQTVTVQPIITGLTIWVAGGYDPLYNEYPVGTTRDATWIITGTDLNKGTFTGAYLWWDAWDSDPYGSFGTAQLVSSSAKKWTVIHGLASVPTTPAYGTTGQLELRYEEGYSAYYTITYIDGTDYT